jgi:hypothetical protein
MTIPLEGIILNLRVLVLPLLLIFLCIAIPIGIKTMSEIITVFSTFFFTL